jgi:hypothetical protein
MSLHQWSRRASLDCQRMYEYVTNLPSCQDEEICIAFTIDENRRLHK